jgi:hypothetical protein
MIAGAATYLLFSFAITCGGALGSGSGTQTLVLSWQAPNKVWASPAAFYAVPPPYGAIAALGNGGTSWYKEERVGSQTEKITLVVSPPDTAVESFTLDLRRNTIVAAEPFHNVNVTCTIDTPFPIVPLRASPSK